MLPRPNFSKKKVVVRSQAQSNLTPSQILSIITKLGVHCK
jgi:hypothetical protein